MSKIIVRINNIDPIRDVGLDVFSTYMSQIGNLPVGTERLLYNPAFLKQQDVQLDKLTAIYKEKVFDACFEIINKFRQTE